jgi:hypothetical protein
MIAWSTSAGRMPIGVEPSKCDVAPAATWSCQPWKCPVKRRIFGLPV